MWAAITHSLPRCTRITICSLHCPPPCGLFSSCGLALGGLRFTLEIVMQPITKNERRIQNDQRGADRYARRRHIDQKLRDMQLARQLREAWE